MERAPLPLFRLADAILADLGQRMDLPGSLGDWMVGIRELMKPAMDEVAGANEDEISEFLGDYGDGPANFQDLLFAIHTVSHFLDQQPQVFSKGARDQVATGLVRMIKVYLFFLECLPTIQEQKSAVLDRFVAKFGDADLKDIQGQTQDFSGPLEKIGNG